MEFYCPRGPGPGSPFKPPFNGKATWEMRHGIRTCTFCGSMHPEEFIAILQGYADDEPGFNFRMGERGGLFYGSRPETPDNERPRFYLQHLHGSDPVAFTNQYHRAVSRWRKSWANPSTPGAW